MSMEPASMVVRSHNDGICVVEIVGELNSEAEAALMEAVGEAERHGAEALILDFGNLVYMNSSGIGLIVTLLIRMNRQKRRLFAFGLSDHYRHIFQLTRLDEAIKIFSSEMEAITAAKKR